MSQWLRWLLFPICLLTYQSQDSNNQDNAYILLFHVGFILNLWNTIAWVVTLYANWNPRAIVFCLEMWYHEDTRENNTKPVDIKKCYRTLEREHLLRSGKLQLCTEGSNIFQHIRHNIAFVEREISCEVCVCVCWFFSSSGKKSQLRNCFHQIGV